MMVVKRMTLLTAHKILISTAVLFFFGFAFWELHNYFDTGNPWAIFSGGLYLLAAAGFAFYLRSLRRWVK
jgi:hypothetical protein